MLKLPFQAIRSSFQWAGTALSAVDSVAQLGGNYADSLLEHQSDAADVRSAERQTDLVTRRAELEAKKASNAIANAMLLENALEVAQLQASVDKLANARLKSKTKANLDKATAILSGKDSPDEEPSSTGEIADPMAWVTELQDLPSEA